MHPDTSGLESGLFLEVNEAYGALADPERRRRYDQQTRPTPARHRSWGPSPEPLTGERAKPEPLRSVAAAKGFLKISLGDSFASYCPSFDELFDR